MAAKSNEQNLNDFFKNMAEIGEEAKRWEYLTRYIVEVFVPLCSAGLQRTSKQRVTVRPYGSSADGLKCCLPHDIGDVDMICFPTVKELEITEDMLVELDGKPGFVRIRGKNHPILNKCLFEGSDFVASATLKKAHPEVFGDLSAYARPVARLQAAITGRKNSYMQQVNFKFTDRPGGAAITCDFAQSLDSMIEQERRLTNESCYKSPAEFEIGLALVCESLGVPYTRQRAVLFYSFWENAMEQVLRMAKDGRSIFEELPRLMRESFRENFCAQWEGSPSLPQNESLEISRANNESTEAGSAKEESAENYGSSHGQEKSSPAGNERKEAEPDEGHNENKQSAGEGPAALLHDRLVSQLFDLSDADVNEESGFSDVQAAAHDRVGGVDFVPAFQGQGWPEISQEWLSRLRQWPSRDAVENITRESFHIVAKMPKSGGNADLDFRFSFSHAEFLLSQEMSALQKECYRCVKLFYRAFLRTDAEVLVTYHLKTVLLWTAEETGLEFWSEGNRGVCVLMLLDKLQEALSSKHLSHYFIRSCNLFEHAASEYPDLLESLAEKVKYIRRDPTCFKWEMVLERAEPGAEIADGGLGDMSINSAPATQSVPSDTQEGPGAVAVRPVSSDVTRPAAAPAQSAASGLNTSLASAALPSLPLEHHLSYHDFQDLYLDVAAEISNLALSGADIPTDDPVLSELAADMRALCEKHPELTVKDFTKMFECSSTMAFAKFHLRPSSADITQHIFRELREWMKLAKFCSDKVDLLSPGNEEVIVQRLYDPNGGFDLNQVLPAGLGLDLLLQVFDSIKPAATELTDLVSDDIPLD